MISSTSAFSIRNLISRGALGRSYSSRAYFRKLRSALRMRRSASMDRSALWLLSPPRYSNSFVWCFVERSCILFWCVCFSVLSAACGGKGGTLPDLFVIINSVCGGEGGTLPDFLLFPVQQITKKRHAKKLRNSVNSCPTMTYNAWYEVYFIIDSASTVRSQTQFISYIT